MLAMGAFHILSMAIGMSIPMGDADASDAGRLSSPSLMIPLDHGWLLATDPENVGREEKWWEGPVSGAHNKHLYNECRTTALQRSPGGFRIRRPGGPAHHGAVGDGASGHLDGRAHNPEANPRAELAGRQPSRATPWQNSSTRPGASDGRHRL